MKKKFDKKGSPVVRNLLLAYRTSFNSQDLFNALVQLIETYHEKRKEESENLEERVYIFVVQWILLWGVEDFKDDKFGNYVLSYFRKYFVHKMDRMEHVQVLLSSPHVLASKPGEIPEETEEIRAPKRNFMSLMTIPLSMLSPRQSNVIHFAEMDKNTICEQLTWIEMQLHANITTTEFLDGNWLKPNKRLLAPNLSKLSDHFNRVCIRSFHNFDELFL